MSTVSVVQVRSGAGSKPNQRATLRALGLGKPGSRAEHADTPQLRGQLRVVDHLVEIGEGK